MDFLVLITRCFFDHVIVLAAGVIEDNPQDLICHLYFTEKRDRFKVIKLFCSSISIHSFLLEDVSINLLMIPVALFPLSGF
jgi:dipeptide/tripeptide permease